MAFFISTLKFMFIILPYLMIRELYSTFADRIDWKKWQWPMVHALLALLILLFFMLLLMGYR